MAAEYGRICRRWDGGCLIGGMANGCVQFAGKRRRRESKLFTVRVQHSTAAAATVCLTQPLNTAYTVSDPNPARISRHRRGRL